MAVLLLHILLDTEAPVILMLKFINYGQNKRAIEETGCRYLIFSE